MSTKNLVPTRKRSLSYQLNVLAHIADTGNVGTLNGSLYAFCCTHQLAYPPQVHTYNEAEAHLLANHKDGPTVLKAREEKPIFFTQSQQPI